MTLAQSATMAHLPPFARLLLPVLEARAQGHPECWATNATLARLLGCCERTVQVAINALSDAQLIKTLRDYTLRSRRRILLLFARPKSPAPKPQPPKPAEPSPSIPRPTTVIHTCPGFCPAPPATPNSLGISPVGVSSQAPDAFVGANNYLDLGADSAPRNGPPLEPPFMVSEENTVSGAAAGLETPPPPGTVSPSLNTPVFDAGAVHAPSHAITHQATPEQVAELAGRVAKLHGTISPDDPSIQGRIRALLARWGLAWLQKALGRAETRHGRGGLENPFGYLERTLRGFQADGGPPPDKAPRMTFAQAMAGVDLGDL